MDPPPVPPFPAMPRVDVIRLYEYGRARSEDAPWLRCRPLTAREQQHARELTRTGRLAVRELREGLDVQAGAYVGFAHLGPVAVQVLPRIAPDLFPLMLAYSLGLRLDGVLHGMAARAAPEGFVESLGFLLLEEVDRLLHSGILRDYQPIEEWLGLPRGKLLFASLATRPPGGRVALPCRHSPQRADVPLNRLTLACLSTLGTLVRDPLLRRDLHLRETVLGEVCIRLPLTWELLQEAANTLDRRSGYYDSIVTLSAAVLSEAFAGFGVGAASAPDLMANMAAVFERFITRLCHDYCPPGMVASAQETVEGAYRTRATGSSTRPPELRPDIVIRSKTGVPVIILDAKYKPARAGERATESDIYQLTLYSAAFGKQLCVPSRIVYPRQGPDGPEEVLDFYGLGEARVLGSVSRFGVDVESCLLALRESNHGQLRGLVERMLTPP